MKAILTAAVLLIAVACGQSQGHQAASSPSTSASPQPLLFAVLQANGTPNTWTYNTVAIVGLDGVVRAKATFTPMAVPKTACMGPILQPSAHVAAGRVFYSDSQGVIQSLAADGTVNRITTFPMTSTQQMLSFAVSPDGTQLLGTVYTVPTNAWPCDGSSSTYTFDTYAAASGKPSTLLDHQVWAKPQPALAVTGWDAVGPIGTYPTVWASQGGGPGSTLGVYVRVDASTGRPGAPLADPSQCPVWNSVQDGSFVCMSNVVMTGGGTANQRVSQPLTVRRSDGTEVWHATVVAQNAPFSPYLAPDLEHVAICCNDLDLANSHELLVGRDGTRIDLARGFGPSGWLDSTIVVGSIGTDLAYVTLTSPGTAVSMGFAGVFVGSVRS